VSDIDARTYFHIAPLRWMTAEDVYKSVVTQNIGVTKSSILAAPSALTTKRLSPSPEK